MSQNKPWQVKKALWEPPEGRKGLKWTLQGKSAPADKTNRSDGAGAKAECGPEPQYERAGHQVPVFSSPRQNQPLRTQDRCARKNEREANQEGRALGSTGCAALL